MVLEPVVLIYIIEDKVFVKIRDYLELTFNYTSIRWQIDLLRF